MLMVVTADEFVYLWTMEVCVVMDSGGLVTNEIAAWPWRIEYPWTMVGDGNTLQCVSSPSPLSQIYAFILLLVHIGDIL